MSDQPPHPFSASHRCISAQPTLHRWDNSVAPRITINSGETLYVEMMDSSGGQVYPGMTVEAFQQIDFTLIHALTGPIAIHGAEPGDVVKIEILAYHHHGWAWTSVIPERCFLPEDFRNFYLHHWELADRQTASMPGLLLDLDPFCGIIGVQQAIPGSFRTRPPGAFGGNMDVKQLTAGATLYLPVFTPGAGLCVGDAHAAQGDGEVSINGMEAPMDVELRVTLEKQRPLVGPYLVTNPQLLSARYQTKPHHAFISSGPDLLECAKGAVRRAIDYLMQRLGLSAEQSLVVCSVALDLKLSQVVNLPNYTVTATLPEAIFV